VISKQFTVGALLLAVSAGFLWSVGAKLADRVWPGKAS
jgi:hypothetical protein